MIRDIVVVLDGTDAAVTSYGAALAAALGASLTGLVMPLDATLPSLLGGDLRRDLGAPSRGEILTRAEAARRWLEAEGRRRSIETASSLFDAAARDRTADFARRLRPFDLVLVAQPRPERPGPSDGYVGTALRHSGCPCLLVPDAPAPMRLGRATIAWDGSAPAARALHDALPLLRRADRTEVLRVADRRSGEDPLAGADLLAHLARHGVSATYHAIASTEPVAETVLDHIHDRGCDLLVAGAYGHSPLREAVLGGVSRSLLRRAGVPVFMAH